MSEKLDNQSKILLATAQIAFMTKTIESARVNLISGSPEKDSVPGKLAADHEEFLNSIVAELSVLMEEIGDHMNGHDMICRIDERISAAPFAILVHGQDDVEEDYK